MSLIVYVSYYVQFDSGQKNITKVLDTFKLETYEQYTKGSKLMELSLGEVTSHRDQVSSIGFFSSIEIFLAIKKVKAFVLIFIFFEYHALSEIVQLHS